MNRFSGSNNGRGSYGGTGSAAGSGSASGQDLNRPVQTTRYARTFERLQEESVRKRQVYAVGLRIGGHGSSR